MANTIDLVNVEKFLPTIVVLMKNAVESMVDYESAINPVVGAGDALQVSRVCQIHETLVDMNTIIVSVLHDFRLAHARTILDKELGFWILPMSTAWFSHFLLHEYDDHRWIQNFGFTKGAIFEMFSIFASL
jgi:hypothetical protein